MNNDIYVVVADNDKAHSMPGGEIFYDNGGPIVFETYVKKSSLKDAVKRINEIGGKYGKCRIAKLEFINIED